MVFVHSKTIINKLDEAHELIIAYPEFKVISCEDFKTDDKIGIYYKIEADAYIDYIIGICDVCLICLNTDHPSSFGIITSNKTTTGLY